MTYWSTEADLGKLAKNRKMREGERAHATKVLAIVDGVLTELTRFSVTEG